MSGLGSIVRRFLTIGIVVALVSGVGGSARAARLIDVCVEVGSNGLTSRCASARAEILETRAGIPAPRPWIREAAVYQDSVPANALPGVGPSWAANARGRMIVLLKRSLVI